MSIMELKNIWYGYDSRKKVLKGINLMLEAGKMYAILGPTAGNTPSVTISPMEARCE